MIEATKILKGERCSDLEVAKVETAVLTKQLDVTSLDINSMSLANKYRRGSRRVSTSIFNLINIESADIPGDLYDVIISTVVLMFLDPYAIPDVIEYAITHVALAGSTSSRAAMSTKTHHVSEFS